MKKSSSSKDTRKHWRKLIQNSTFGTHSSIFVVCPMSVSWSAVCNYLPCSVKCRLIRLTAPNACEALGKSRCYARWNKTAECWNKLMSYAVLTTWTFICFQLTQLVLISFVACFGEAFGSTVKSVLTVTSRPSVLCGHSVFVPLHHILYLNNVLNGHLSYTATIFGPLGYRFDCIFLKECVACSSDFVCVCV
jgi:hypothetical protein